MRALNCAKLQEPLMVAHQQDVGPQMDCFCRSSIGSKNFLWNIKIPSPSPDLYLLPTGSHCTHQALMPSVGNTALGCFGSQVSSFLNDPCFVLREYYLNVSNPNIFTHDFMTSHINSSKTST